MISGFLLGTTGCTSPGDRARVLKENERLRVSNERLERTVAQRDATIAGLSTQVENLSELGPDRPVGQYAATRIEIASLSRGADFDGQPGDDGVTVYLRPRDSDGDVVKAPGRIRIELLDGSTIGSPRVLGVCEFDDPQKLKEMWHGKFLTQHYTVRCPFPPGTELPANRKVVVRAEFLDYLTGATLTDTKEVSITPGKG